jgi:aryl-alcohol dehydrogenase-like predicted oxidoreductase
VEALYPYPAGLAIATKRRLYRAAAPITGIPDGRPEHLREALDASLKRLRPNKSTCVSFTVPILPYSLRIWLARWLICKSIKFRHIGLSNVDVGQQLPHARSSLIVSVQNQATTWSDRADESVLNLCDRGAISLSSPGLPRNWESGREGGPTGTYWVTAQ